MSMSGRVAATVAGVIVVAVIALVTLKVVPLRARAAGAGALGYSEVAGGEVGDSSAALDGNAVAQLERMGGYLRTLKAFQLKADVMTEDVRTDGQKVQVMRAIDLVARR